MMKEYQKLPTSIAQVVKEGGIITLKQIHKTAGAFRVSPAKDPQRPGFYLGVDKLSEEEKKAKSYYVDPEKLVLKLEDGKEFNLSDEVDRLNWRWMQYIPEIKMSFEDAQKAGHDARFYVLIEDVESGKTVSRLELKNDAMNLVRSDEPTNYASRARLLGRDMRGEKVIAQKEFLLEEADKRPARVIAVYKDDTVGIKLLVLNALDKKVIEFDSRIYSYGTTTLGMSEDAITDFLLRTVNKPIRDLIQNDLDNITNPAEVVEKDVVEVEAVLETVAEPVITDDTNRPRGGN